MEREGEGREGRGRRGIIIGGIVLSLFIACNNGGGDSASAGNGLSEIGRSVEGLFYNFIELMTDVLGFTAKVDTKKEDIGKYFSALGKKLVETSDNLEDVAKKSEMGVAKSDLPKKNPIREAVDTAKGVLATLKGHVDSLGTVGDSSPVGDAETSKTQGKVADDSALKKVYNALKEIVKIAISVGVKELKTGTITLSIDSVDNKEGAKILATSNAGPNPAEVSKSAIILTAVSGEEILDSIVKSGENDIALSGAANGTTTAISFARGGSDTNLANASAKAAAVAGGIALRSLIKTSKLAAGASSGTQGGKEEVQKVGIAAVNKLLGAIEDVIKKTVKNILEQAKEKIEKTRNPQESVLELSKK